MTYFSFFLRKPNQFDPSARVTRWKRTRIGEGRWSGLVQGDSPFEGYPLFILTAHWAHWVNVCWWADFISIELPFPQEWASMSMAMPNEIVSASIYRQYQTTGVWFFVDLRSCLFPRSIFQKPKLRSLMILKLLLLYYLFHVLRFPDSTGGWTCNTQWTLSISMFLAKLVLCGRLHPALSLSLHITICKWYE